MTLAPSSYNVRQALRWVVEERLEMPEARLLDLVSVAARRFDLSPRQEEEVFALLKSGEVPDRTGSEEGA